MDDSTGNLIILVGPTNCRRWLGSGGSDGYICFVLENLNILVQYKYLGPNVTTAETVVV